MIKSLLLLLVTVCLAAGQSTHIVAGIYTNAGSLFTVGASSSSNSLVVADSGWLENGVGIIGQAATAHRNSATVRGAGSKWQNTAGLYIGDSGSENSLRVLDKAHVENGFTLMGANISSSNNVISVETPEALFTTWGELQVGAAGSFNSISVLNSRLQAGVASIGFMAPSRHNSLLVRGQNSWCFASDMQVGSYGASNNRFVISEGADSFCFAGFIGNGHSNQVWVTDPGSLWQVYQPLRVGYELGIANSLVVSNSARGICASLYLDGDQNSVVVSGPGSSFDTGGVDTQIVIGSTGQNNCLMVTDGAELRSWSAYLTGFSNSVSLAGIGSTWNNHLLLRVGEDYMPGNRLFIRDGAELLTYYTLIAGDQGGIELSGQGAMLEANYLLSVGGDNGANNSVIISNRARVLSGAGVIGGIDAPYQSFRNPDNSVRVFGFGSTWIVESNLTVGMNGPQSSLRIEDGGYVECGRANVGEFDLSPNNLVYISGPDSVWKTRGDLWIGYGSGNNAVVVTNAGSLACSNAIVGRNYTRLNKVVVAGPGSAWNVSRSLIVGNSGAENQVAVSAGARLNTQMAIIDGMNAFNPGKSNTITAHGLGTQWNNEQVITVGSSSGFNQLRIENGAAVTAGGLRLGNINSLFGNAVLISDASLTISNATANAHLELIQGDLHLQSANIYADRLLVASGGNVLFNSGEVRLRALQLAPNRGFAVGNGIGAASLTLGAATHVAPGGIQIAAGASLECAGTLQGPLTNSGALKPGVGTLNIEGPLALLGDGEIEIEIGGRSPGTQHDFISIRDGFLAGGRLRLKLANGFVPASNDVLTILSFPTGVTGAFSNAPNGGRVTFENSAVSCRVQYTTTEIRLRDFENAMPAINEIDDAWAFRYFGHAPLTEEEKRADLDGDGHSTQQEYAAGTAPDDYNSALRILPMSKNVAGQWVVRFQCATNRSYLISSSSNFLSWTELGVVNSGQGAGICQWADTSGTSPRRFYRITLR